MNKIEEGSRVRVIKGDGKGVEGNVELINKTLYGKKCCKVRMDSGACFNFYYSDLEVLQNHCVKIEYTNFWNAYEVKTSSLLGMHWLCIMHGTKKEAQVIKEAFIKIGYSDYNGMNKKVKIKT